jgi:PAS domain S-box-containing protein
VTPHLEPIKVKTAGAAQEITGHAADRDLSQAHARQQEAVAELGQRALAGISLPELMNRAAAAVAKAFGVEFCEVLELLPGAGAVGRVAGVGWQDDGLPGREAIGIGRESQAGYTLTSDQPIVVEDLRTETRFTGATLLGDHGVISGISVVIAGEQGPWGVLAAHTTRRRVFTRDDVHFFQSVANVIAGATQRRRVEERLEQSHHQLQSILDSLFVFVGLLSLDGVVLEINRAPLEASALERADVIGRPLADVYWWCFSSTVQDRLRAALGRAAQGEVVRYDEIVRVAHGRRMAIDVTFGPLRDAHGKTVQIVGSAVDITERKLAEQQLVQQAALLDKARDAILVRDLDHRVTYWNKGAERLYGWTSAEAMGGRVEQLLRIDPGTFREADEAVRHNGAWNGEIQTIAKSGAELTLDSSWTMVRDGDDRPKSILTIDTDVTERKRLEHQYLRAQRLESLGTLAGGIAHDLNNVLTPIMMSIELLTMDETNKDRLEVLATIRSSAKRGANMIKQVLSFARGVEGRQLDVQVAPLLRDVAKIANDTFLKSIQVCTVIPADLWTVSGDPTQLEQVLLNLCVNARDAMPEGGSLALSAENVILDEYAALLNPEAKAGAYVTILVEDDGMGMPQDIVDKIFDPFFTTKELGKGTGLGLSTSLGIVKSHGGFIRVHSDLGKGTRFSVYLPAQVESQSGVEVVAEAAELLPLGHGELVLVVDDEAALRQVTRRTLEKFGYRAIGAADGAAALAMYASQQDAIAVVLMDMMMPAMDGSAIIHGLLRIQPEVRIIAASGLSANGPVARAAGAKHFLPKPYTTPTLLKTLRRVLQDQT